MKFSKVLLLLIALILLSNSDILAQDNLSAVQTAENLRAQLRDVQAEEFELQARLQQLDVDLKPENIERFSAGTGSTRPEELREQRRRYLQTEKDRVVAHLEQVAASRVRLEVAISSADAAAYQQSAQFPATQLMNQTTGTPSVTNTRLIQMALVLLSIIGVLALVVRVRRRRRIERLRF